jgi:4-carboxymuconolactone decarboxylase
MRLPVIAQADLSSEQRPIYEDMRAGIERSFQRFKSIAENGALLGPWNP